MRRISFLETLSQIEGALDFCEKNAKRWGVCPNSFKRIRAFAETSETEKAAAQALLIVRTAEFEEIVNQMISAISWGQDCRPCQYCANETDSKFFCKMCQFVFKDAPARGAKK